SRFQIVLPFQFNGEVVVGHCQVRPQLQGQAVFGDGAVGVPGGGEGKGRVKVRLSIIVFQMHRNAILGESPFQVVLGCESVPQVVVGGGEVPIEANRLSQRAEQGVRNLPSAPPL